MKMIKKIATLLLAICLLVPCFSIMSYAADGEIMFTDPSTKTGEVVEIKGVVKLTRSTLGKIEITMTYDTSMLKFKSGDGVTESAAGTITYVGDATRDVGTRKEFVMKFDALKVGSAKLQIKDCVIKNVGGSVMDYVKGSSTVTIAQGTNPVTTAPEPVSEATVDVNGEEYQFASEVPENEIPKGYEAATLNYDMVDYNVVYSESSGLYLAYLINAENVGKLFMYVEEDATFAPYETIEISDNITIALLSNVSEIELPSEYEKTEVVLNDQVFPAWQNKENSEFCVIYAINNNGVKSLYQLDKSEGTYQRFSAPEIVAEEKETWVTKLSDVLEEHLDYVILGTGLGFLLFILIIVILSVKLYNRNAELDEIYEEYGLEERDTEDDVTLEIDEDEEDEGDYSYEEETASEEKKDEMESLVQEGMREVFPEETAKEGETMEEALHVVAEEAKATEEVVSLGEALEEQKASEQKDKPEIFDEDDEVQLEDFSVDFIDLEDE